MGIEEGLKSSPELTLAEVNWGSWEPLEGAGRNPGFSGEPGLYRIRRVGQEHLDYIGQTGVSLRQRLGMLSGTFGEVMPYSDPHTAAPAFWAVQQGTSGSIEATALTVHSDVRIRKGLESLAILLHRREWGHSPSFNFGRMPDGFRKSSGNSQRLVAAGKRFRGGHDASVQPSARSLPFRGDPYYSPIEVPWMGMDWTPWQRIEERHQIRVTSGARGLYRVKASHSTEGLTYVGMGRISDRLKAHFKKRELADHPQGSAFADTFEVSWVVLPGIPDTQLLELENDLIGAHLLAVGHPPKAQFLG